MSASFQGDSGGPLVCEHTDGMYFVDGVTSWGSPACAEEPSVFADVVSASSWITDASGGKLILKMYTFTWWIWPENLVGMGMCCVIAIIRL